MLSINTKVPLSNLTTMRTGGFAEYFCTVSTIEDLKEVVQLAKEKSLPIVALGGGSNVLVEDGVFAALVVKLVNNTVKFTKKSATLTHVTFGGGLLWDTAVSMSVERELAGIECLSAIPGNVGAAPVQNIGAYGQELSDTFHSLTAFDTKRGLIKVFTNGDCNFGYRESIFKTKNFRGRYIIFEVTLALRNDGRPTVTYSGLTDYLNENKIVDPSLQDVREAVIAIRSNKLENPSTMPNTGSFFKNPLVDPKLVDHIRLTFPEMPTYDAGKKVKIPAAWLIEKTGWKGKRLGKVGVSSKHALVLINPDGLGTADDIIRLRDTIINDVKQAFGITLEPEVQFLTHP